MGDAMKATAVVVLLFVGVVAGCSRGSAPAPTTTVPADDRLEGLPADQKRQADEDVPPL